MERSNMRQFDENLSDRQRHDRGSEWFDMFSEQPRGLEYDCVDEYGSGTSRYLPVCQKCGLGDEYHKGRCR